MSVVLVLVETEAQEASETSLETLTLARSVAERRRGANVHAVLVGRLDDAVCATVLGQLGTQGVAVVHQADIEELSAYSAAGWAAAVVTAVRESGAEVVMAAGTPRGSEVMAHVATRLDATMAAQVVAVREVDPVVVARQVMGGSALEVMEVAGSPAVITVAGHAVEITAAETTTVPEVRSLTPELTSADLVARVVRVEATESDDTAALTGARVVVGAGRGAGSAEGFGDLLELTEQLDGALGVSRVVTSLGWRPHAEQVGQTGSRISPDVYIACGISGAIQHWAGCASSRAILAINTDPEAPMMTRATYAVVGDMHEVVPAIIAELRRRGLSPAQ
jgi:electron transfer flavoprotein alpha subunit